MSKVTPEILPREIRDLVKEIEATAEKSDDHTITVAERLRELRRLIEAGAVGEVNWYTWAGENVNSPLKKASLTGFHATAKHIVAKAVSPSSETMRMI